MSTSVSSVVSHFPSAENGFTTTTSGSVSSGAVTVGLNSVAGYTNGEIAVFVIDPTDTNKKQTFTGTIDTGGVQVTGVIWTAGTNQIHALGATVVDYATATHISMMTKGLLVGHTQTGAHVASLPLTTPRITTAIHDANGVSAIAIPATASAVNGITVTDSATGVDPSISATGTDSAINLNLRGKGLAKTVTIGAGATTIFPYDYVVSGCVWTGDSYGVNLNASMTAGVVVINGNPVTVALVTARAFTLNLDTYIDVLDAGNGTGTVVYTTAATNAASPALAANSIRIGIIQAAATITAATKVNQGQEDRVFPIASSIPYAVTDTLGNLICPRDPNRRVIGYRQILTTFSSATSGSYVDVTGLSVPAIVPTARKVRITITGAGIDSSHAAGSVLIVAVREGATALADPTVQSAVTQYRLPSVSTYVGSPSAGLHTYLASIQQNGTGTMNLRAGGTGPAHIMVELI